MKTRLSQAYFSSSTRSVRVHGQQRRRRTSQQEDHARGGLCAHNHRPEVSLSVYDAINRLADFASFSLRRPRVPQKEHFDSELSCDVSAFPSPSIFWRRDNRTLTNTDNYEITHFASEGEVITTTLRVIIINYCRNETRPHCNFSSSTTSRSRRPAPSSSATTRARRATALAQPTRPSSSTAPKSPSVRQSAETSTSPPAREGAWRASQSSSSSPSPPPSSCVSSSSYKKHSLCSSSSSSTYHSQKTEDLRFFIILCVERMCVCEHGYFVNKTYLSGFLPMY